MTSNLIPVADRVLSLAVPEMVNPVPQDKYGTHASVPNPWHPALGAVGEVCPGDDDRYGCRLKLELPAAWADKPEESRKWRELCLCLGTGYTLLPWLAQWEVQVSDCSNIVHRGIGPRVCDDCNSTASIRVWPHPEMVVAWVQEVARLMGMDYWAVDVVAGKDSPMWEVSIQDTWHGSAPDEPDAALSALDAMVKATIQAPLPR